MRAVLLASILCFSLIIGCCGFSGPGPAPAPLNLTFSESLNPSYSVYAVDKNGNEASLHPYFEYFFPVQRRLPAGTAYSFRLIRSSTGEVVVPASYNYTAYPAGQGPPYESGTEQYHGFQPGEYTLELVKIEGAHGYIVARSDISIYSPVSPMQETADLIAKNCSQYAFKGGGFFPSMETPGAREMQACISDLAIAENDPEICKGISMYINNSMWDTDGCIGEFAVKSGNISTCSKRDRAVDKALCRAEILGDVQECYGFECDFYWSCEEQQQVCLQNFALSHRDVALCRQVQNDDMRNRCLGMVLYDASYCRDIKENESRASCLQYISNAPQNMRQE